MILDVFAIGLVVLVGAIPLVPYPGYYPGCGCGDGDDERNPVAEGGARGGGGGGEAALLAVVAVVGE